MYQISCLYHFSIKSYRGWFNPPSPRIFETQKAWVYAQIKFGFLINFVLLNLEKNEKQKHSENMTIEHQFAEELSFVNKSSHNHLRERIRLKKAG